MRALVVEDDLTLLCFYTKVLRSAGHQVYPAATIHAASLLLARHHFDICIFDVQISNQTSFELLAQFPALQQQGTRIIVISGQPRYRAFCDDHQVEFYLKPIQQDKLLQLVAGVYA
ncbi:MAG: hypothetical protein OHK0046_43920 [Anaerolineae bacterium]